MQKDTRNMKDIKQEKIKPLKILILEDDPTDLDLLLRELRKSGLHHETVHVDTREAFEKAIDQFKPGLILSDYSLPGFDAPGAFAIKQQKKCDAPFILVSGTIGEENAVLMIKNGVTDYVLKDKLFTLTPKIERALKEVEETRLKKIAEENLREQNAKLLEIAFLQSHQVRVPVTHIMGLFNLFHFDNPTHSDNIVILHKLKTVAESLDTIIHQINEKTRGINNLNRHVSL
jgi:CheY-like chemotaxis protein